MNRHRNSLLLVILWITSCSTLPAGTRFAQGIALTDHINTPILSIYGQQIKGPWYTRDAAIRTLFTDSLCIHASAYSSDTTRYTLSTGKDQTTADEAPIYLTFTSLEGAVSRFSVESLTDSSLVLMSLENGNIWTLTRGSK